LKKELSALNANEQRQMTAFLVSLQDVGDSACRQRLSAKIDKLASEFATLEELDRRLNLPDYGGHLGKRHEETSAKRV
jgi:hypothetical protein